MKEELSILRIKKSLHEKAKELADANNMTLSTFSEKAMEAYIDKIKYSIEYLLKKIENHTFLSIHKDEIKKEFFDAPIGIIRGLCEIIKEETKFLKFKYQKDMLEKIIFDNTKSLMFVKINDSPEMNLLANSLPEEVTKLKLNNININFVFKKDSTIKETPEILFFSTKIKENDKNDRI